jgi:hypothetical protein
MLFTTKYAYDGDSKVKKFDLITHGRVQFPFLQPGYG